MNEENKIKELEERIKKLEKAVTWIIYRNADDKRGRLSGMGERPF